MILDSVGKCDVDVRRDLYSGIILTGTTSDLLAPSFHMLYVITAGVLCTDPQEALSCATALWHVVMALASH